MDIGHVRLRVARLEPWSRGRSQAEVCVGGDMVLVEVTGGGRPRLETSTQLTTHLCATTVLCAIMGGAPRHTINTTWGGFGAPHRAAHLKRGRSETLRCTRKACQTSKHTQQPAQNPYMHNVYAKLHVILHQIARNPAHHRRTMKSKCVPVTRVPCHRAPVKAKGHGMAAEQTVQQFTPTVLQYSCNIGKNKYSLQYSPHPQPIAVVACRKESLYHTPARQQEKNATTGCGCQGIPWGIPPPAVQHIRSSAHR